MSSYLKIMTCGNVDDGKSTLLGRLFFETGNITKDQSSYLDSKKLKKSDIDYSLLLDGLIDEKSQGITIDIAFKYFRLGNKPCIFIDSPGHTEYTRNMANAATFSNVALVIFDITKPLSDQTKNHLKIVKTFPNIKKLILIYNKLDKLGFNEKKYKNNKKEIDTYIEENDINVDFTIPVSALKGENITSKSKKMEFYEGPSLLEAINSIKFQGRKKSNYNVLPIQYVSKFKDKRIYFTKNFGKSLSVNDEFENVSSNEKTKIKKIYSDGKTVKNVGNYNIGLELSNNIDLSKGDVLSNTENIKFSNSFKAQLIVTSKKGLSLNKRYLIKFRHTEENGFIPNRESNKLLKVNTIGTNIIELENKVPLSSFSEIYDFSQILIIDKSNNETVAFGYVVHSLDKGIHVIKQNTVKFVTNFEPRAVWFTGLSGSGKTTLANKLAEQFKNLNIPFYIIDGDNIRQTLNQDLGFSKEDRLENNRRIAHLAKILIESNIIPIVSTISPNKESRQYARELIGNENLSLVYLSTPLEVCIKRDPKQLYKDKNKKIKNITGLHTNYDVPTNPDITIDTSKVSKSKAVNKILEELNINK